MKEIPRFNYHLVPAKDGALCHYSDYVSLEADRQYHMNAINHLASEVGFDGTSEQVVWMALEQIKELKKRLEEK